MDKVRTCVLHNAKIYIFFCKILTRGKYILYESLFLLLVVHHMHAIHSSFIPSIILSVMNIISPEVFRFFAEFELWRTDLFVIQLTVIR